MHWRSRHPQLAWTGQGTATTGPVVEIPPQVYAQLQAYVNAAPGEISGFGLVEVVGDRLVVGEVFCPPQMCTCASTDVDAEALADLLIELVESGRDPGQLRLWWHSHAGMPVFFSGVDRATMASSFPEADWILGLVLNRAGEVAAALETLRPLPLRAEGLAVRLHVPEAIQAAAEAQVRAVVRVGITPAAAVWRPAWAYGSAGGCGGEIGR